MTADELAVVLESGANGCDFVAKVMPPELCKVAIQLLGAFRAESMNLVDSGIVGPGRRGAMASVNILDIVIQLLQNVKQANEAGSFAALADTCRWLEERKRILKFAGRFIHQRKIVGL